MTVEKDLVTAVLSTLGSDLAQSGNGFDSLAEAMKKLIGPSYFSVSMLEQETVLRRVYSSAPDIYPCGDVKCMAGTGWEKALINEQRHLFSPDAAALHFAFQDADAIIEHGFGCAINLRMALNGVFLGSVNLLSGPGAFSQKSFHLSQALVGPLALALALEAQLSQNLEIL